MNNINKTIYFSLITLFFSTASFATKSIDVNNDIKQCSEESDNSKRLSCFDALSKSLNLAVETSLSVEKHLINKNTVEVSKDIDNINTVTSPLNKVTESTALVMTQSEKEEAFAEPEELEIDEVKITSITLTIEKLSKMIRGEWKITFTNGQVWLQKGSDTLSLKSGQSVEISKGSFNAYYLNKVGANKLIPVKRLK